MTTAGQVASPEHDPVVPPTDTTGTTPTAPDAALLDATPNGVAPADAALAGDAAACEPALFDVFAAVAARQPNHLAVDDGILRLSYAELRDQALALGARIAAVVPPDGLVGVLLPTTALYPAAWLACLAARRPFLPLDPNLPLARLQAIIDEAGLAVAIVPTRTADLAAWLPAALPRMPMAAEPGPDPAPLPTGLPPSEVGMVLFTSGSTGRPKCIALHAQSQAHKAMQYRDTCRMGPHDRLQSLHPPSTPIGMCATFAALLSGASFHPADLRRDGLMRALALLRDGGITLCAAPPSVVRAFLAMDGATNGAGGAFGRLRIIRLGGEAVTGRDIAALGPLLAPGARVLVGFGLTESGATIAQRLVDPHGPVEPGPVALVAEAVAQTLRVEDASGAPVGPGEIGELVVIGRHVALGHWIAGRLDSTGFPADPSEPGNRRYRTGDLVRLRPDGMLVPIGRSDRQVKIHGMRVEPAETEAALRGLPGVADAAVIVQGGADAPVLVAFVVATAETASLRTTAQRVRGWRSALAALLPPQGVPAQIRVVPTIPLLPSLKPDPAALRARLTAEDTSGVLARVWARLRGAAGCMLSPVRPNGDAP